MTRMHVAASFLAALFIAISAAGAELTGAVYPAAAWEHIRDPAAAGWPQAGLDAVRARLANTQTTGFLAISGGRVLMEYGDVQSTKVVASVRKSLLSTLFGNYVASGKIRLDKTLLDLGIDDTGGLSAAEKEATVRDLLSARSGIYHAASNGGDDSASASARGAVSHGTYFLYNNWDFNALGTIFEKETGKNIYDAFESDLARPLEMQDFDRAAQRKSGNLTRSMHPAYHIRISTRDLARVGYLMLREGKWSGQQLVPRDWVKEMTRAVTHVDQMNPPRRRNGPFGYGYLWWIWDGKWANGPYRGAYTAIGLGGQHLSVFPALDLVIAHETHGLAVPHREFFDIVDVLIRSRCNSAPC